MNDKEIIIDRRVAECIEEEIGEALRNPAYFQFKISITDDTITIIPRATPVEIKL